MRQDLEKVIAWVRMSDGRWIPRIIKPQCCCSLGFSLRPAGYLTAVFGQLVGPSGSVLGVEKMEPLAQRSINSMQVPLLPARPSSLALTHRRLYMPLHCRSWFARRLRGLSR
jgi:hypothetical protein